MSPSSQSECGSIANTQYTVCKEACVNDLLMPPLASFIVQQNLLPIVRVRLPYHTLL